MSCLIKEIICLYSGVVYSLFGLLLFLIALESAARGFILEEAAGLI
jgi:hypothetical protein